MSQSIKRQQDYRWTQIGSSKGLETPFFRLAQHEFRDVTRFASYYPANRFDALDGVIAKLSVKSPKYVYDVEGTLDIGAALAGESECYIRRDMRPSKRLRLGINPSNASIRKDLENYKAAAYVAVIKCARKMGFTVEAEMIYGGMSEQALSDSSTNYLPWSLRVMLGTSLPVHVLAAYGTNFAIMEASVWQHESEQTKDYTLCGCHYQTQDTAMRNICKDEFDICFDRLMDSDTVKTMREFLTLQLKRLNMTPDHIEMILKVVRDLSKTNQSGF